MLTNYPPSSLATERPTTLIAKPAVAISLLVVLLLAAMHLPFPFAWDQAVFFLGAERLAQGGKLYVDFWDVNQPGIFFFYQCAGQIFGFNEVGIHFAELILQVSFSAIIAWTLAKTFRHSLALAAAPLLTIGYGYAIVSDWHLTQAHFLLWLPIYLTLHFALRPLAAEKAPFRWFFVSGFAGACVLATKLVLLPLVASLWAVGLLPLLRLRGISSVDRGVIGLVLGASVPVGLVVGTLAAQGTLDAAIWTWFVFPMQALDRVGDWNLKYFVDSVRWMLTDWTPVLLLAVVGIGRAFRSSFWLASGLVSWFAIGALCLLLQRLSGWQYQFMLLLPPVGLLAAFGIDELLDRVAVWRPSWSRWRHELVVVVAAVAISVVPMLSVARKAVHLGRHDWALTRQGRWSFQVETSRGNAYGRWQACSAFLFRAEARPGPIYVLGDPVMYWIAKRRFVVPRCGGTMMNQLDEGGWRQITRGLESGGNVYIFVSNGDRRLLQYLRPASEPMLQLLETRYRAEKSDDCGTWYVRKAPS